MTMKFCSFAVLCCLVAGINGKFPTGHLKPFGAHKPPTVVIDEFTKDNAPHPEEFYENYVKHSKAAIFRGGITGSRAFQYWTDEYVRENFGDMEVRLEGKHEKKHMPPVGEKYLGRDTIGHFIDNYHNQTSIVYVVSDLPEKMYKDVGVLPCVGACGDMGRSIVEVNLWWSGGGTSSIIHKDAYHQINCLVNGTKYWKLIENKYEKDIYKHPEPEYEIGGFSDVNPKEVDLKRHPKVARVDWSNITINAGDCLYLPKSYYHQVDSTGTHNLAVSLLITRFDDRESLDFSDCTNNTDYQTVKSLGDFEVQHIWKGKGYMVMGSMDLEDGYRATFLNITEHLEAENKGVEFDTFREAFEEDLGGMFKGQMNLLKAYSIMDRDGDGVFTNKEAKELTLDELRRIGAEIEPYEPSNSYNFEYSILSFDKVWELMRKCLRKYDVLTKQRWIRLYLALGGTNDFGSEVFTRLSRGKPEIVTKDVTKKDLFNALENWVKYWAPQYSGMPDTPKLEDISDDWELPENDDEYDEDEGEDDSRPSKSQSDLQGSHKQHKNDEL